MRKAQLQNEAELEKFRKKKRLDFLDILLFAQVSRHRGLRDDPDTQEKGKTLLSQLCLHPDRGWEELV